MGVTTVTGRTIASTMTPNTTAAIMSEGVAGAGTMRSQMRVYLSQNGSYTGATYVAGGTSTIRPPDIPLPR